MICVAKEEVNLDTELRACFVPELPLSADTLNRNANSHPLFYRREEDGETEELPNLSEEFMTWIQGEGEYTDVDPLELSTNIWYHVLSILSSPQYNESDWLDLPAGIVLPVPIPQTLELLERSACLGRQIASLQRLDVDNVEHDQELENAIDAWFDQIEVEPYSISGEESSAAIIQAGVCLDRLHGTSGITGSRVNAGRYRFTEEQDEINEDSLGPISNLLDLTTDVISQILGPPSSIQLSTDVGLRNVPRNILEMSIGGHVVVRQWLAWRCQSNVTEQPIANLWTDLRRLLINMAHMRLLLPGLDQNFHECSANCLEWD